MSCNFCENCCSCHINSPCSFCTSHTECAICGQPICADKVVLLTNKADGDTIAVCPTCAEDIE